MVKRYPHQANIIVSGDTIVGGECVLGNPVNSEIIGRYDVVNTNNIVRANAAGDEVIIRGEFYTKHKPIVGATKIEITMLGVSKQIVCWHEFQNYSVISV